MNNQNRYFIAVSLNGNACEWYATHAKSKTGAKIAAMHLKAKMQQDFPSSHTRALVGYGDGYNVGCLATCERKGKWVGLNEPKIVI